MGKQHGFYIFEGRLAMLRLGNEHNFLFFFHFFFYYFFYEWHAHRMGRSSKLYTFFLTFILILLFLPIIVKQVATSSSNSSPAVKVDVSGSPLQSFSKGPCNFPGCTYGRRIDPTTGHTMDYCSKTCATKDAKRLSSAAAAANSAGATSGKIQVNARIRDHMVKI